VTFSSQRPGGTLISDAFWGLALAKNVYPVLLKGDTPFFSATFLTTSPRARGVPVDPSGGYAATTIPLVDLEN